MLTRRGLLRQGLEAAVNISKLSLAGAILANAGCRLAPNTRFTWMERFKRRKKDIYVVESGPIDKSKDTVLQRGRFNLDNLLKDDTMVDALNRDVMRFANALYRGTYNKDISEDVTIEYAALPNYRGLYFSNARHIIMDTSLEASQSILTLMHEIEHSETGMCEYSAEFAEVRAALESLIQFPELSKATDYALLKTSALNNIGHGITYMSGNSPTVYDQASILSFLSIIKNNGNLKAAHEDIRSGRLGDGHIQMFYENNNMIKPEVAVEDLRSLAMAAWWDANNESLHADIKDRVFALIRKIYQGKEYAILPSGFSPPQNYVKFLEESDKVYPIVNI